MSVGLSPSAEVLDGHVDEPGAERLPFLVRLLAIVLHISPLRCGHAAALLATPLIQFRKFAGGSLPRQ